MRVSKPSVGGHVVLSFTPGLLNEDRLRKWLASRARHINATSVEEYARVLRENYDPNGDAGIGLEFVPESTDTKVTA